MRLGSNQGGIALIIAVLFTVLLTVAIFEFSYSMRVYASLTGNSQVDLQGEYAARSGISFALATLKDDLEGDLLARERSEPYYDALDEDWAEDIMHEDGVLRIEAWLTDEESKINVNELVNPDTDEPNDGVRTRVLNLFSTLDIEQGDELVDSLIDWIDADSLPEASGAEDDYYLGLDVPYICKNAPLGDISELLMVKGFDRELLYGESGLVNYLTTYNGQEGRINVNTASEEVLDAVLSAAGSSKNARDIIDQREREPFTDNAITLLEWSDISLSGLFTHTSTYFSIHAEGTAGQPEREIAVGIYTVVKRIQSEELLEEGHVPDVSFATVFWRMER